ncbi:S-layer homology domain-containing protein [Bacillus infantis]|uniref:S-layer homology domain-containing protein n=1 Tax=Bacillus infantis TaxID=324767 RepID=UPI00215548F6|nr:Ig-like domain-containing protein [Bacillus infantis]MCR6609493.1 Ig-like domain-containing protein [Bacillus infantis]
MIKKKLVAYLVIIMVLLSMIPQNPVEATEINITPDTWAFYNDSSNCEESNPCESSDWEFSLLDSTGAIDAEARLKSDTTNGLNLRGGVYASVKSKKGTFKLAGFQFGYPSYPYNPNTKFTIEAYKDGILVADANHSTSGPGGTSNFWPPPAEAADWQNIDEVRIRYQESSDKLLINLIAVQVSDPVVPAPPTPSNPPAVTSAAAMEDTKTNSGLKITSDESNVTHYKIEHITGGTLYKNDGATEIADGSFITKEEGEAELRFLPDTNENTPAGGIFSIDVRAAQDNTGKGLSEAETVTIEVTEVNDAPIANDDTLTSVIQNSGERIISISDLLSNDEAGPNERNQSLAVKEVKDSTGGTVRMEGSNIIFTPNPNVSGPGSFKYVIQDDGTTNGADAPLTDEGLVSFTIEPRADMPAVTNSETDEDVQTANGLVITSSFSDKAVTTHYKISGISGGRLYKNDGTTVINEGSFITEAEGRAGLKFTPAENAYGSDGFGFYVQAAPGTDDNRLSNPVPAAITVLEVNDAPAASNDTIQNLYEDAEAKSIPIDHLLSNDSKGASNEAGQKLDIVSVDEAVGGTVQIVGSSIIFTPQPNYYGNAGFRYKVKDNGTTNGHADPKSDTATVGFQIEPQADVPGITSTAISEDNFNQDGLVITKNADDGSEITHFRLSDITGGTLYKNDCTTVINNGSYITLSEGEAGLKFKPDSNEFGNAEFSFKAQAAIGTDDTKLSDSVPGVMIVTEVNDEPTAADDNLSDIPFGTEKVMIPFNKLIANDLKGPANESGQSLTVTDVMAITGGTVSIVGGQIQFVPDTDFLGTASFTYTITDNGTTNGMDDHKTSTGKAEFNIYDADAPIIALHGDNPLYLLVDELYFEPGFAADDTVDGDLTNQVAVTGIVTTDQLGVYNLKYNVKDSNNNAALEETREIRVVSNELKTLEPSSGDLTPLFDPKENNFSMKVTNNVASLDLTAIPLDPTATLTINGLAVDHNPKTIPLKVGENTVIIVVTSQGGFTKTYTVEIKRAFNSGDSSNSPKTEIITVDVDGENGENLNKTPIKRTTESNGTVRDDVTMPENIAKETVEKAKVSGNDTARIIIPDEKDIVTETNVDIPRKSLGELKSGNLNLEIFTENATVSIPKASLINFSEDLYFRFIPIKKEAEQLEVIERAKKEKVVREALGEATIEVVGRPMTIETNLQSRKVDLIMPLLGVTLPSDPEKLQDFLNTLGIFIEHSDGEKVLIKPEPVEYKEGLQGLKFTIEKFSTFTIVSMDNLDEYFNSQDKTHSPYIKGYKDGTFRPEAFVSRAEMAAMLARNLPADASLAKVTDYQDIAPAYWGYKEIMKAKQAGIMIGLTQNGFHPGEAVTRAQIATIAYRWMKQECKKDSTAYSSCSLLSGTAQSNYTDVASNHWAIEAIHFMKQANVMEGYKNNTFRPEEKLTRAQAVKVLNRLFKRGPLNGVTKSSFSDVSTGHWAFKEIEEAGRTHSYILNDSNEEYIQD